MDIFGLAIYGYFSWGITAMIVSCIIANIIEVMKPVLAKGEKQVSRVYIIHSACSVYQGCVNLFGLGTNAGRLYTHTDIKLLKAGGGSE